MNVYDKAIDLLREHGWIRYRLRTDAGMCATGAIRIACGAKRPYMVWTDAEREAVRFVASLVMAPYDLPWGLSKWNDEQARNVDDVIGLLKRASEAWDLEH